MAGFADANFIRVYDFYLAMMFLIGLIRRRAVYIDAIRLVVALRGRWPKLFDRLRQHHGVLVTSEVLRPLGLALALTVVQMLCSRVIWPQATVTAGELAASWWKVVAVGCAFAPMFAVDLYFLIRVGSFDRGSLEGYLDTAEHWLGTWKAPLLRRATFGYIDPRRMVDDEVKKGLEQAGVLVSWSAWWVSAQVALRVTFGLTIWSLWAWF